MYINSALSSLSRTFGAAVSLGGIYVLINMLASTDGSLDGRLIFIPIVMIGLLVTGWRRQIIIDRNARTVNRSRGIFFYLSRKAFPLAQYNKLEIWKQPMNKQIQYIGGPGYSMKPIFHVILVNAYGDAVTLMSSNRKLHEMRSIARKVSEFAELDYNITVKAKNMTLDRRTGAYRSGYRMK